MDNTDDFFIMLLNSTDRIVQSDFACVDILAWANEMSIAKYNRTNLVAVAAFLAFGFSHQVTRCKNGIRNYLHTITDSGARYENGEQQLLVSQRDDLSDLQKNTPKLLEAIVSGCGLPSDEYYEALAEIKKDTEPYDDVLFAIRNIGRMKRYLDSLFKFTINVEEAKLPIEKKLGYFIQFFFMPMYIEGTQSPLPRVPREFRDYYSKQDNSIHRLLSGDMIKYDGFDLKITQKFTTLIRGLYSGLFRQFSGIFTSSPAGTIQKTFSTITGDNSMLVLLINLASTQNNHSNLLPPTINEISDENIIEYFIQNNIIDIDGFTLTDLGVDALCKSP